jgi:carbon storage regulator CsrA
MLVLARRIGEEIRIAENISVTVVAVKGAKVRLGITAPPSVPVERQELLQQRFEEASVTATATPEVQSFVDL